MPANPCNRPGRVLLLLPDIDVHEARLSRAITELLPQPSTVVVLSLLAPDAVENRTHLRIAILSALLRHEGIALVAHVVRGTDWVQQTRKLLQKDDLLMCLQEHLMADSIGLHSRMRPIHSYLVPLAMKPVVVSGIATLPLTRPAQTMRNLRQLVLPALIFVAFSTGQMLISLSPLPDVLTRVSLLGSAMLELALIGFLLS